jgi:phospholipid transport system substrate-binding protein
MKTLDNRVLTTAAFALAASLATAALPASAAFAADAAPAASAAITPTASAPPAPGVVATSSPSDLIDTAAQAMLKDLDAHRAEYRKDPVKVQQLVDRILLPHFDTAYAAQLVLGTHWKDASEDQRKRFVNGFYHSLLNNYGEALIDFTADRMKVLPYNGNPGAKFATVRTQIRKNDGSTVQVNYSLHQTPQGWMAWDVNIEGISYVKSFRDDFGAEIDQKGLDSLLQRLEKQANSKPGDTDSKSDKPATKGGNAKG